MTEKTIKVSDEVYAILESLRKENESLEMLLLRLLPSRDTKISKDDFFNKWIGSDEEIDSIFTTISSAWKDWSNSLQT